VRLHDRHTARPVTFIAELFDVVAFVRAGATGHRAIDDIAAHVGTQCLVQRQAQARVGGRVRAALLGGDRQLADPLGEYLAPLGILALFAVLDVRPLGMTRHNDSRSL